ncbi:unnamed protein product [Lactuca virosa]|uniref:Uncharacterized protein n=1 Tax=Lactuca virosa TaxID=75947 RepID=A0AAU9PW21_9ASTR|nr:unnamed protein product [Lactuca virosa]
MTATPHNVDPTTTNDEEITQLMMMIQNTNLRLVPTLDQYPEELRMLIQTLNNSNLSYALSSSFAIPMEWLSLSTSTTVFNKTNKVVTFQLSNSKTKKLTQKQLA